ncbi:MAG: (2Fe-2S) ferredoxin domain-containing protein [Fusobacteriaceae bacterium]
MENNLENNQEENIIENKSSNNFENNSESFEVTYCNGRNCGEFTAKIIDKLHNTWEKNKNIKCVPSNGCMGQCKNGPNLKIDGIIYNRSSAEKLKMILEAKGWIS